MWRNARCPASCPPGVPTRLKPGGPSSPTMSTIWSPSISSPCPPRAGVSCSSSSCLPTIVGGSFISTSPSTPPPSGQPSRSRPRLRASRCSATEFGWRRNAGAVAPPADVLRVGAGRPARARPRGVVRHAEAAVVLAAVAIEPALTRAQHLQAGPGILPRDVQSHRVPGSVDLQPCFRVARGLISLHYRARPLDLQAALPVARGVVARHPIVRAHHERPVAPVALQLQQIHPVGVATHLGPGLSIAFDGALLHRVAAAQQPHPGAAVALHLQP